MKLGRTVCQIQFIYDYCSYPYYIVQNKFDIILLLRREMDPILFLILFMLYLVVPGVACVENIIILSFTGRGMK